MRNLTTLCYIEQNGKYLMLHRVKKKKDVNQHKWIGVGGHFEPGESPEECLLREVKEETGLTLLSWRFRGIITFQSQGWGTEYMCLFTADRYEGVPTACNEGTLEWIPKEKVLEVARALHTAAVPAPVQAGQVVLADVCGTGVAVVATKNIG